MTSMIDGIRMEKLARFYERLAVDRAEPKPMPFTVCVGCHMPNSGDYPCAECTRLVADTLRDAAARADK